MSYEAPYKGLRVVDLSQGIAGPYCGMLLAQYGADVIKIEPKEGDWSRHLGMRFGEHTAFSVVGNLGKRSVVLDLKDDGDQARLWELIKQADIFMEGFRPGVIGRLGFDYEQISAVNPRILYLSISGFGQVGPLAEKPAMDPILQAYTGFMANNRDKDGIPIRTGPIIIDMCTALYAFQALAPALYARQGQDHGRKIEVSLMEGAANLQIVRLMQNHLLGSISPPMSATAPSGAYPTKDGYIMLLTPRQREFELFCQAIGAPDMGVDPRFQSPIDRLAHWDEINERTTAILSDRTAVEWTEILTEAGVQNERVLDYPEFLEQPQVRESGLVSWLEQPGMEGPVPVLNPPGAPRLAANTPLAHAPLIGEHTAEVMAELDASA
jgi:crotonobetainyl-CoA:carnitine CoA-transferase CaiB-like acyl-CoA transferase